MKTSFARGRRLQLISPALLLGAWLFAPGTAWAQPGSITLIPAGAVWKYLDTGTNAGTAWQAADYDDSFWCTGPAQLGYWEGDEATVINFGPDPNNKYITYYFRHEFSIANAAGVSNLNLRLLCDDGAVVYLNGAEVVRYNMPAGPVDFSTPASTSVGGSDETNFFAFTLDPGRLTNGVNCVAVEVHQANAVSADLSFDLELAATGNPYGPVPPQITAPPASQTVSVGQSATFSVAATGTLPLSFQWRKDSVDLSGATNATLTLINVQPADAGLYSVAVSNPFGSAVSGDAALAVVPVVAWGYGNNNIPQSLTNVIALAAGYGHSLGLKADGTVVAWGDNYLGEGDVPPGLTEVVAIAAGGWHSVALKRDGTVVAWGYDTYSEPTYVPAGLSNVVAIAAGRLHTLGLKADGTVAAWGDNSFGQTNVPPGLSNVIAIAAGDVHSLALRADGTVVAWGDNSNGQSTIPAWLGGVVAITAGGGETVVLWSDGRLLGWGWLYGSTEPVFLLEQRQVVAVAASFGHCLALLPDGTIAEWGAHDDGTPFDTPALANVAAVAAGGEHSLALIGNGAPSLTLQPLSQSAIAGDTVYLRALAAASPPASFQWLFNGSPIAGATDATLTLFNVQFSQAGNYQVVVSNAHGSVTTTTAVLQVGPSISLAEALDTTNLVWTTDSVHPWHGQAGVTHDGQDAAETTLIEPETESWLETTVQGPGVLSFQWKAVCNGDFDALSFFIDGAEVAVTWGHDLDWRPWSFDIPFGTHTLRWVYEANAEQSPAYGAWLDEVRFETDGDLFPTCPEARTLLGWGENYWGALDFPVELTNRVVAMAAGRYHTMVLTCNGRVFAWGGAGSDDEGVSTVPIGLSNVVAIAAGRGISLALKADGTVVSWGPYYLADYIAPPRYLTEVVAIAAGYTHGVALRRDGTVVAWGNESFYPFLPPAGLSNVVAIAAGGSHSLALKQDGTVVAWGSGSYGETQVPPGLTNVVAITAGDYSSFALRRDGTVVGWGMSGVLDPLPTGLSNVVAISGGFAHTLALKEDGTVVAWGAGAGTGPEWAAMTNLPPGLTNVTAVAAGTTHSLALQGNGSPVITVQPHDRSVPAGGMVELTAMAVGTAPLSYQWWFQGSPIPGATDATLTLFNAQFSQAGNYQVVVSNALGAVVSASAILTVSSPRPAAGFTALAGWGAGHWGQTPILAGLTNGVAIALGDYHCMVLKGDGTVVAWGGEGSDYDGVSDVPAGLSDVVAIAAGRALSLALRQDGTVVAWWPEYYGHPDVPAGLSNVVAISAGVVHALALRRDGAVVTWGINNAGQLDVPNDLPPAIGIAAGGHHSLALLADGTVVGWGFNGSGQASPPAGLRDVVALAARDEMSLALRRDGTVVGWGRNDFGQATPPAGLSNVVAIAAGGAFGLALKSDGTVGSWGIAASGVTDVPPDLSNVIAIAGSRHLLSLALVNDGSPVITVPPRDRTVPAGTTVELTAMAVGQAPLSYQWLFNGSPIARATNATLTLLNMKYDQAGNYQVVVSNTFGVVVSANAALTVSMALVGWGWDRESLNLEEITDAKAVALGHYQCLVLKRDGTVVGWGSDAGSDYEGVSLVPPGLSNVVAIAAGYVMSVALCQDGSVVEWGPHFSGGAYTAGTVYVPQQPGEEAVAISAGVGHTLALRRDGTVVAWGRDDEGQASVPEGLRNVVGIAAGSTHSLALLADGTVVGWGYNNFGQTTPPPDLTNAVAIEAGAFTSLALRRDGTVVGWGHNDAGQATPPPGLSNVVAITSGDNFTLGLKSDGTVVPWGTAGYGSTDVPPGLSNVIALTASYYYSVALVNDGSPVITVPPRDRTVSAGTTVELTAMAVGAPPLWYQWLFNGSDIPGATNTTLTLSGVQATDAGRYAVRVANAAGSVLSEEAMLTVPAPGPTWDWARKAGGNGSDVARDVAVDRLGNAFLVGEFEGAATFGNVTLTSLGRQDIFIAKYDEAGNMLWARNAGGGMNIYCRAVAVDDAGNASITGAFDGTARFGPFTLSAAGEMEAFIASYDPAGNVRWARSSGGAAYASGNDIAVDASGSVFVTGEFNGTLKFGNYPLTSVEGRNLFLVKLNSIGAVLWSRQAWGSGYNQGLGVALDGAGSPFVIGGFEGSLIHFGSLTVTNEPGQNLRLAKYSLAGQLLWTAPCGVHDGESQYRLAVDAASNAWVFGSFAATNVIGATRLVTGGWENYDLFVAKFDAAGHAVWARQYGGPNDDWAQGLALDPAGNLYLTGYFMNETALGPFTLNTGIPNDLATYVAKLDPAGNVVWADVSRGTRNECGTGLAVNAPGEVFLAGYFSGTPRFGNLTLQGGEFNDAFLARLEFAPPPPVISVQLASQTVMTSGTAMFRIAVRGSRPVAFQWLKDGVPLAGQTNQYLILHGVSEADAGVYAVVVANSGGAVTSAPATLAVLSTHAGPGSLDLSFDPTQGGEAVSFGSDSGGGRFAVQPDGRILIGGSFIGVDGRWRNRLARLLPSGRLDSSFIPYDLPPGYFGGMAVQPDGRILVGAASPDTNSPVTLARLYPDGRPDPGFHLQPTIINGFIHALLVQPDGKVLLACSTRYPVLHGLLVRLLPDGAQDPTFPAFTTAIAGSLALQPDGKLLVGACWQSSRERVVRLNLDGTVDPTFDAPDIPTWNDIYGLLVQPDGKILISGHFDQVGSAVRHNLARLNPDGSLDPSFDPGTGCSREGPSLGLQSDGKILVASTFLQAGTGVQRRGLARLNPDGSLDPAFDPCAGPIPDEISVGGIWVGPDDRILASGYWMADGEHNRALFRLNADGTFDPSFDTHIQAGSQVHCVAAQADGKIVVGGRFDWFNDTRRTSFLRLNSDGTLDLDFNPVLSLPPEIPMSEMYIKATLVQPDGKILLAGRFATVSGVPRNGLARLNPDGSVDASFDIGSGFDNPDYYQEVLSLALQPDGKVLAGGCFREMNGVPRTAILRLNPNGSLDTSFDPGLIEAYDPPYVSSMALQADGKIVIAGYIESVAGQPRTNIARLNADGSLDLSFNPHWDNQGWSEPVVRVQPDGKILVAVSFYQPDYGTRTSLVRLNPDGTVDPAFTQESPLDGYVLAMVLQPDGKILVGGQFATAAYNGPKLLLRFLADGRRDTSFIVEQTPPTEIGQIKAIELQSDGRILIGGIFNNVQGVRRINLARLNNDTPVVLPTVTIHPPSQVVVTGGTATFWAEASGTWRLTYQWQKDGAPLPGQTNQGLTLHRVREADAGAYAVVVTNLAGAVTSAPATLTVLPAPTGPGSVDLRFPVALGWGGPDVDSGPIVSDFAKQADGKVIIAGFFDSVFGVPRRHIARLLGNDELDPGFNAAQIAQMDGVNGVALQPDGKIVAIGWFSAAPGGGQLLARLNSDGSFDPSMVSHFDPDTTVLFDVAVQPDGKILIAGSFTLDAGPPTNQVARLNADGSVDPSFQPFGVDFLIYRVALQPDGKIVLAGRFNYARGGELYSNIARLNADGSLDADFQITLDGYAAYSVEFLPDGAMLVGGWINRVRDAHGWFSCSNLVRLAPNGSVDTNFCSGAPYVRPSAIALQPDGKILIGGEFLPGMGQDSPYVLARLLPDGRLDPAFTQGLITPEFGGRMGLEALMLQDDGSLLVGGDFTDYNDVFSPGLVRLRNDVMLPFVRRNISRPTVQLIATPPGNVSVYAVEDRPPPGLILGAISHGGVFDLATGKVKFGPFYDAAPRALSYQFLIPPGCIYGECGILSFTGTASADGLNTPIIGDQQMVVAGLHPADLDPADNHLSIGEVTAYGAAWRRGSNWPQRPVPIPINYVTRAGALWRGGECYTVESTITNESLWWVNCEQNSGGGAAATGGQMSLAGGASGAISALPSGFVPGEPVAVSIAVSPAAGVRAYAVEDQFPAGWAVLNVSEGGEVDGINGKVKWGPFLDGAPRTLTYRAMPPLSAVGATSFSGTGSFDGAGVALAGARQLREGCRLSLQSQTAAGQFALALSGRLGAQFLIEASADLVTWTPLTTVTNTQGRIEFSDPARAGFPQRFYRARLIE